MTTAVPGLPETMSASVLTGTERIELQERPVPVPEPTEVLVEVGSVGVCGSDVHYYRHGRIGDHVVTGPLVLGHELGGRIAAVGAAVDESRIGERVAVEPQRPCRACLQCKAGRYNLCPDMRFYATPPIDGAFCGYVTIESDFAHPIPDTMSDDAAALLEPLSVGVWACHKAGIEPGSSVFIAGAGPIGAVTALAARARGATDVIVSDLVGERRRRITDFGATRSVDPAAAAFEPGGLGFDAFIDCSGAAPAIRSGITTVRGGGRVVLVGMGADSLELPVGLLQNKELTLTGTFRYANTWPAAIALATSGAVDLDALVTATYPLDQAETALRSDEDPASMKSVVRPGDHA